MLRQILELLLQTAFGFFIYVLMLRFYMQALRAPLRNPLGQFVSALSDWIVLPARRLLPAAARIDLATLLIAWIAQTVLLVLVGWLRGGSLAEAGAATAGFLLTAAALELAQASLYLLIGVVIVQVLIHWVNPYAPLAPVFDALTRPFYAVFRRVIPTIGGVDLSPLFVVLLAEVLLIVLGGLARSLQLPF